MQRPRSRKGPPPRQIVASVNSSCADHSLQCNWMQRDMNEHEEIAKALKARLSELRTHLAKVNRALHKLLPADSEDQAIELENQEALEVIKKNTARATGSTSGI